MEGFTASRMEVILVLEDGFDILDGWQNLETRDIDWTQFMDSMDAIILMLFTEERFIRTFRSHLLVCW